jgi:hypothetical protein
VRPVTDVEAGLVGVGDGRGEVDDEVVVSVDEHPVGREAVGAVLVDGACQLGAVEGDRGDGVEALEHEVVTVVAVGAPRERGAVLPVARADPGDLLLVAVEVGVGDEAGGEQVGVHEAGHRGGDGRRGDVGGHRAAGRADGPAVVERAASLGRGGGEGGGHLVAPAVRPL